MQGSSTRLRQIADDQELPDSGATDPVASSRETERKVISAALQIALRTLSQKTVVALANLFSLLLAGAVFWVFLTILEAPTVMQLIGAGMFAIFVLALHLVRKRPL